MSKYRSSGSSSRSVSPVRLHQTSGPDDAFGRYAKVNYGGGTFRVRLSGRWPHETQVSRSASAPVPR